MCFSETEEVEDFNHYLRRLEVLEVPNKPGITVCDLQAGKGRILNAALYSDLIKPTYYLLDLQYNIGTQWKLEEKTVQQNGEDYDYTYNPREELQRSAFPLNYRAVGGNLYNPPFSSGVFDYVMTDSPILSNHKPNIVEVMTRLSRFRILVQDPEPETIEKFKKNHRILKFTLYSEVLKSFGWEEVRRELNQGSFEINGEPLYYFVFQKPQNLSFSNF